jgi:hypothetical protein
MISRMPPLVERVAKVVVMITLILSAAAFCILAVLWVTGVAQFG